MINRLKVTVQELIRDYDLPAKIRLVLVVVSGLAMAGLTLGGQLSHENFTTLGISFLGTMIFFILVSVLRNPLSHKRVEFFSNDDGWWLEYATKIIREAPASFDVRGTKGVFAVTSYSHTTILEIGPERIEYLKNVARICTKNKEISFSHLVSCATSGKSLDNAFNDIHARLAAFDSESWNGQEYKVRCREVPNIDIIITGNSVLISTKGDSEDAGESSRQGIYIKDRDIASAYRGWFREVWRSETGAKTNLANQGMNGRNFLAEGTSWENKMELEKWLSDHGLLVQ